MPQDFNSALSLDAEAFRMLGHQAVDMAADYLANLGQQPVFQPMRPEERSEILGETLQRQGVAPEELLAYVRDHIFTHPMGNGHPRFLGWVNSPPAPLGIIAELLAATVNPSCAGGDHAAIYLEYCATRWLMELLGYPVEGSIGLLVSGGSMASLTCLAAARHWVAQQDGWNVREEGLQSSHPRLVLYVSEEGHSCIRKSAELLGLGAESVRVIPTNPDFRYQVATLRETIARDTAAGLRPFCIVASAGTVNTGAIDPLDELANICEQEGLWFHIDGAYGGVGILDPKVAPLYTGLTRANSIAIDPHKWLSVPVECGCAIIRDKQLLRDSFSLVPPYLRLDEGKGFANLPWFSEYGFQQTRGFRALKFWMVLQGAGKEGLINHISRHNYLANYLKDLIEASPDFEILAPVTLSVVCLRFVPAALQGNEAEIEKLNREIVPQIQAGGETFITGTVLKGKFALRACVLHSQTNEQDLEALLEIVRRVGGTL